jgi:hypothetical protein
VTESGGSGGAGNRPADDHAPGTGRSAGWDRPATPDSSERSGGELPRWQPFADAPPALPDESTLTPAPQRDEGSIAPTQLPDAPAYVPAPLGMTTGAIMPPPDPSEIPTSAWITTAPQAPGRGGRSASAIVIIASIIGIILVGAVIAGVLGLLPSDKGKILFGTAAGKDLCSVGNPTNAVKTTDPIFFAAVLKEHLDGQQAIVFHITKDGVDFLKHDEPADGKPFDCYGNKESLGALAPGSYVFEVLHNNDVEAKGSLTVQ